MGNKGQKNKRTKLFWQLPPRYAAIPPPVLLSFCSSVLVSFCPFVLLPFCPFVLLSDPPSRKLAPPYFLYFFFHSPKYTTV